MEKLTENMIRWAENKLGSTKHAGWCLAFVEDVLLSLIWIPHAGTNGQMLFTED